MTASKIEWTGRSDWNPLRGCTRFSPGCIGCYAEAHAARFSGPGLAFEGFARMVDHKPRWTGRVEVQWDRLPDPLRWRKPATIFALSMSDLFHEALPVQEIASVYAVMVAAVHLRGHVLQVLTKRSGRMREILNSPAFWDQVNAEAGAHVMERTDPLARRTDDARATLDEYGPDKAPPGIWLGVSVEDQQRAAERIPDLLATSAAIRFLSCEPLLGPIDLTRLHGHTPDGLEHWWESCLSGKRFDPWSDGDIEARKIDWVIAGGESGPNARPAHPDWFRSIRDQCRSAGAPFFFKQWGAWISEDDAHDRDLVPSAGDDSLSVPIVRVGKKAAGALLDGIEHKAMPG